MNRRAFLTASVVVLGGFCVYRHRVARLQPSFRSVLFDDLAQVRALGAEFRRSHPHTVVPRVAPARLPEMVRRYAAAIEGDFENGRVLIINGWLVSSTEAQICASV